MKYHILSRFGAAQKKHVNQLFLLINKERQCRAFAGNSGDIATFCRAVPCPFRIAFLLIPRCLQIIFSFVPCGSALAGRLLIMVSFSKGSFPMKRAGFIEGF
ncbi:hypothetical protein [Agrobacterium deltaense]|uniref:hypothetical protein n=1 Tax=Agrobacterium deltaense TaxID=1183412 RepID=UPI0005586A1D|nr:hypothetical protein [Agrobacterium deltaense]